MWGNIYIYKKQSFELRRWWDERRGRNAPFITDSCAAWIKYTRRSRNIYLTLCKVMTWDEWWMSPVIFQLTAGNVSLKPSTLIPNYCSELANLSPADDKMGWQKWKVAATGRKCAGWEDREQFYQSRWPLGQLCRDGSRTSRPPAAQFIISARRSVNYPHRASTLNS